ncbi:MAG: 1-acyl-sn-glycerol-3-phosphate acyltransferase [Actinobacteria bacterium]|nr:1-acyl-sn-glycerol-3-phosphate acyltransferase [Actinomycetota bacterium]
MDEARLDEVFVRRLRHVHRALRIAARYDVGPPGTIEAGPVIHAANHRSMADLLFAAAAFHEWGLPIRCLVAASYFGKRGIGRLLRDLRCIPVEGTEALQVAAEILERGIPIAIMPEGRIVGPEDWDEARVGRPHPGVGRLAIDTGLPVVAVGAAGTEDLWPRARGRPFIRPWNRTLLTMRTRHLGRIEVEQPREATAIIWEGVKACVAEADAARGVGPVS